MNGPNNECLNTLNTARPQIIRLCLKVAEISHVCQLWRRLSTLFSPLMILISAIWSHFPVNKCEHLVDYYPRRGCPEGCQESKIVGTSVPGAGPVQP